MHGEISWILGFVVIVFSIGCTESRPKDLVECEAPTEYYTVRGNESIPVGCPQGRRRRTPWDPITLNVTYKLYERSDQRRAHVYSWNHSFTAETGKYESLGSENNSTQNKRILVLVHGFTQSGRSPWLYKMKKAYFAWAGEDKVDVLIVDWKYGASGGDSNTIANYIQAASNVPMVGRLTANFVARLAKSHGVDQKFIHLFGHSLGAQTVGEASFWLRKQYNITVGRVSAMDPAEVLFRSQQNLLYKRETSFLEVIHVTASPVKIGVILGEVGLYKAVGHVDLYPNGGKIIQPGCRINSGFFCSHNRGATYYQRMLEAAKKSCDIEGSRCASERAAYWKKCNKGRIDKVWSHINSLAKKAISGEELNLKQRKKKSNKSEIIFFETDKDQLKLKCESDKDTAE